jgi:hypothetical protein
MYFNHAYHKLFLGTAANNPNANLSEGFIITAGLPTSVLANTTGLPNYVYGPGTFGFFDPNTWTSVTVAQASQNTCCPLILASASLLSRDKIGPFAGGYKESNKSKIIKPKHITRFYRVDSCEPQQTVVSVGNTNYTDDQALELLIDLDGNCIMDGQYDNVLLSNGVVVNITVVGNVATNVVIVDAGTGLNDGATLVVENENLLPKDPSCEGVLSQPQFQVVTAGQGANCCKEFLCDETYYLRIDVKGSPALRFLNHNAYWDLYYYTGCCTDQTPPIAPNYVDSTLVFIGWAEQIVTKVPLQNFIFPVVYDEAGTAWFPPGSTITPDGLPINQSMWWDKYVSSGHTPGACAGMRLFGAYEDTVFNTCTFQPTDFFMKEPLKILASEVDVNGDPCVFSGLCIDIECPGRQGMGFGDTVLKDLILSESYLQNFVHSDLRIREITLGTDIVNSVIRTNFYTRYVILHNVPRYNNPSGTYDNDQYALEIITSGPNNALEVFMNGDGEGITGWLPACAECVDMEIFGCSECTVVPTYQLVL